MNNEQLAIKEYGMEFGCLPEDIQRNIAEYTNKPKKKVRQSATKGRNRGGNKT
jgi:hypothetical protein